MTRLPRVVNVLLQRWLPGRDREFVLGDLEEECEARGRGLAARCWLWRQAVALLWSHRHERRDSAPGWRSSTPLEIRRGPRAEEVMETFLQDLRYAVRVLRKDRPFSLVAILTLALGIGVSTALFSVIDAAILRPLPYPDPEQLVAFRVEIARPGRADLSSLAPSIADVRDRRDAGRVFSQVGVGRFSGFRPPIVQDDAREGAPGVALDYATLRATPQ